LGDFIHSVLENVVSTLIEYGIIKPKFDDYWGVLSPKSRNRDWATAIRKSVRNFRKTQGRHIFGHYQIEDIYIAKGKGRLKLIALPKSSLCFCWFIFFS